MNRIFQLDLKQLILVMVAVGGVSVGAREVIIRPASGNDIADIAGQIGTIRTEIEALRYELCEFKNDMRAKDGVPPRNCQR